jgi:3-dehydroquinate synthase
MAKPHETVAVNLGSRSYQVRIGRGLLASASDHLTPLLNRKRVAIVTDDNVAAAQLMTLAYGLERQGISVVALTVPPGEGSKNWAQLARTVDWMLEHKIERRDVVIALGGGVVGDLVGFAAAILRRGVRFVQMPTSLLAQVDSSVGGKTGINSVHGKNLVGAFHQPSLVLADIDALSSLPARELRAGYGEVVKYGLLGDAKFFDWLEGQGAQVIGLDPGATALAVRYSVQMKADIVARDETEEGERALLNLGHTFGHALEKATGYGDRLLHGEGVSIGCALAFDLSARLGLCSQETPSRVRAHLKSLGLPTDLGQIPGLLPDDQALLDLMGQDKKVVDGQLRFILARGIGQAFVADKVPAEAVLAVLAASR